MTVELIQIMNEDIKRCEEAQSSKKGSYGLYQILIGKYNGEFENFEKDIPQSVKTSFDGEFDYRQELMAIKEKLELLVATEKSRNPMFDFKIMFFSFNKLSKKFLVLEPFA